MNISRQNSERLWEGVQVRNCTSLLGGSGVFVHSKCCSASSLPHINKDQGGGAEKISVRLGSLLSPMFLFGYFTPCFGPFFAFSPTTEPGHNLCKSLTMGNVSVSFFLPFFLTDRNLLWQCHSCCGS